MVTHRDPPPIRVEVAWTVDPFTRPGALDWVRIDEVAQLRQLTTRRGARMKTGEVETGEAKAVLDNRTRALDPGYAASPWAPNVTLRKRIRFVAEVDSTDVEIFTGYIDRLPTAWTIGDGWVDIEAVDMMALIAGLELPPSVLHQTIVDLAPLAYWPLGESQGTFADDVAGVLDGTYRQPVTSTSPVMPYDDTGKAEFFAPYEDDPTGQAVRVPNLGGATAQTISFWWQRDEAPPIGTTVWVQTSYETAMPYGSGDAMFWVGVDTGGNLLVAAGEAGGTPQVRPTVAGTGPPTGLHHFAVVVDASDPAAPVTPYIDGVAAAWYHADPAAPTEPFTSLDWAAIAAALRNAFIGYGITISSLGEDTYRANVADVAYWDRALTDAEVADIYAAGTVAWDGDRTGERVARILDILGIDTGDRDLETGTAVCGPTTLGDNALAYLRKIAATEGGPLFVAPDGKLTFRSAPANDPTPVAVFAGNPDDGTPYADLTPDYSLDRLVNIAEVTRENGVTHTVTDPASRTTYGPATLSLDTMHRSPSGARSRAASLVIRGKDVRQVITDLALAPRRTDVPLDVALGIEIGDPATVRAQPTGPVDEISELVIVERIEQAFDFQAWDWRTRIGVDQQIVLPCFAFDDPDAGWDAAVWCEETP